MKKMLFFAAIALAALGSCTSDEFVGENNPNETNENYANAIVFGTGVKAVTRGTSADAALLNNNFVFFGTKTKETTTSTVFNNYQANFADNSAYTTESNSSNWEYVSYYNVPDGVTTTDGVTTFAASNNNTNKVAQTIKYWDYATEQYDFAAYSLGSIAGETPTYATASAISFANLGTNNQVFTLTGTADQLKACYISDLVTAYNKRAVAANPEANPPVEASDAVNDYGQPVQFKFRSLAAKIRIAFFETIPGYSVKDVQFYSAATGGTASTTPTLFTSTAVLPSGSGTMKVTYPTIGWDNRNATDYNKAHVSFTATNSESDLASTLTFGVLANYPSTYEGKLTSGSFIGRTSNTATYADGSNAQGKYYTILPMENGANLQLRIKYTLQATDGYGETITVDNATAVVPVELAQWNPNYAYTYIFKISDMTNGSTGVDGNGDVVTGLTPITLDAVVVDSEDGVQETITTVSTPSITTYAEGKVITTNDEYKTNAPIYVIVNDGTNNVVLTVGTNARLFTATVDDGAVQTISEASVANAFDNGTYDSSAKTYTVTDAEGKKLVLTDTESTLLTKVTEIVAADSPTGNIITVNGAKFIPTATGTYVFQYVKTAPVPATPAVYTAVADGTTLTDGNTYFNSASGEGEFVSNGTEVADGTNYYMLTTPATAAVAGEYQYKVIKVTTAGSGD